MSSPRSTHFERDYGRLPKPALRHPAQWISLAFALGLVLGTGLLLLPWAHEADSDFMVALFTATSALCVTGLSTVDVPSYWTTFGEVVILALIQAGGLGLMALATLLSMLVSRKLGLRSRLTSASESHTLAIGDVRQVLYGVVKVTLIVEAVVAVALATRFALAYDHSAGRAAYLGLFHAVSSFNNAGFALFSDNLISFAGDPWISLPIDAAVILGGIGFPVLFELRRQGLLQWRHWSLHTRLTVWGYLGFLVLGFVFITAVEWTNPATIGHLDAPARILSGFTQAVQTRTAGFNTVPIDEMRESSLFAMSLLMFIGGGSAGTAGGIKVGTFLVLFYVIWAEVRGHPEVEVGDRRIGTRVQRQALSVALLAVGTITVSTLLLMILEPIRLQLALFEVTSAFATVGLSAGVTPELGTPAQLLLIMLMFVGRVGTVTLASALALRARPHFYRLPESRPIIG